MKCLTCKHFHEVRFKFEDIHKIKCYKFEDLFKNLKQGNYQDKEYSYNAKYPDLTYCNQYSELKEAKPVTIGGEGTCLNKPIALTDVEPISVGTTSFNEMHIIMHPQSTSGYTLRYKDKIVGISFDLLANLFESVRKQDPNDKDFMLRSLFDLTTTDKEAACVYSILTA